MKRGHIRTFHAEKILQRTLLTEILLVVDLYQTKQHCWENTLGKVLLHWLLAECQLRGIFLMK